jgi:hypothetical protein
MLTFAPTVATEGGAKKSVGVKKSAAPAADGEKKKRKKTRKETYSSYIYKGMAPRCLHEPVSDTRTSSQTGPP